MQHLITTLGPIADTITGSELSDFAKAIEQHGRRCIRPRVTIDELPFETQPVPWTKLGRFLTDSTIRPGAFLQFAAGDYAVQDAASLLPLALMELTSGQAVIDCCAAPGGKSAAILEQLAGTGLLVSNEVIASRIDTLQLTVARTGYGNYMLSHHALDRLVDAMSEQFDCVLVDAPCTGQSLVGRGKQSLSAFSEHQVAHSAARQQTILESAMQLVRPGGRLVYSTCTFAYAENEGIIGWLREQLPDWSPVVLEELSQWETPNFAGCYRLWPHRDHCAGGFAAALSRRALAPVPPPALSRRALAPVPPPARRASPSVPPPARRPLAPKLNPPWSPTTDIDHMNEWSRAAPDSKFYTRKQQMAMFDSAIPESWRDLAHCGIEVATKFGQHWQPAYPVAVLNAHRGADISTAAAPANAPLQTSPLTDQEALTYFSGTSIHRSGPAGWQVVTWRDRPLGWAKQVGTQLKNHLPKPLRQPNLKLPQPQGT